MADTPSDRYTGRAPVGGEPAGWSAAGAGHAGPPSGGVYGGTVGPAGHRRRRRRRRVLLAAAVAIVVLIGAGAAGLWGYTRSLNGNIHRTNAFSGVPTSNRPTAEPVKGAMNVLVVGSDSRDPGNTSGSRTDTIMLAHLDADHQHGYVISIPRDTWTYVPASADGKSGDTNAKINAAYAWGGVPLLVQTVEHFTGVRIDHVVIIDFAGFQQVVDALGGVDMYVDQTITSIHPPHRVFTKGMHHFDGAQALDYVRQRYQFANGDFTRESHQQEFLKDLLDKAASSGTLSNPLKLNAFLQALTKSITVDQQLDVVGTAVQLRDLRSSDLTFLTSPSAGTGWEGDQSVVFADTAKAKTLYQDLNADNLGAWVATNGGSGAGASGSPSP